MLRMTSAIPTGRKSPTSPLDTVTAMNMNPLIAKSIAAVLYSFDFLDGSLFPIEIQVLY